MRRRSDAAAALGRHQVFAAVHHDGAHAFFSDGGLDRGVGLVARPIADHLLVAVVQLHDRVIVLLLHSLQRIPKLLLQPIDA